MSTEEENGLSYRQRLAGDSPLGNGGRHTATFKDRADLMKALDNIRMDKSAVSVVSLHEDSDEREFWHSRTPRERLEALELMRQINYGYDPATARLQRVLEVAQRAPS